MTAGKSFLCVLLAYGICQLVILIGDVTIVMWKYFAGLFWGSTWPYNFAGRGFELPVAVEWIVNVTADWLVWARTNFQHLVNLFVLDVYNVSSMIVATAVLEEIQFRGPLWLLRKYPAYVWWPAALLINVWFLLCHNRAPIYLIYIFTFAMMAAWLVRKTGKLWPSIVLHMIYNAYWFLGGVTNM